MTITLIPDIEKVVADYLREHPDVVALGARVLASPPKDDSTLWVQYTLLAADNDASSIPEHLVGYLIQFDCYAGQEGGKPEANDLARTVRAVLIAMPGEPDDVVVTSARIVGHARIPDTDFEKARDREVLTARIHAHA